MYQYCVRSSLCTINAIELEGVEARAYTEQNRNAFRGAVPVEWLFSLAKIWELAVCGI